VLPENTTESQHIRLPLPQVQLVRFDQNIIHSHFNCRSVKPQAATPFGAAVQRAGIIKVIVSNPRNG
jgi:hypothetical protein